MRGDTLNGQALQPEQKEAEHNSFFNVSLGQQRDEDDDFGGVDGI